MRNEDGEGKIKRKGMMKEEKEGIPTELGVG